MRKYGVIIIILSIVLFSGCDLFVTDCSNFHRDELTADIVDNRYIEVESDKKVDYIEWTIDGETWGRSTDSSGYYASIDVYVFECVTYGTYKVEIQAYYSRNGYLEPAYDEPLIINITI